MVRVSRFICDDDTARFMCFAEILGLAADAGALARPYLFVNVVIIGFVSLCSHFELALRQQSLVIRKMC